MIYPSIDLMSGKAVQLVQGKKENKKIEIADVFSLAETFAPIGDINVIDLDAALGLGSNRLLIQQLATRFRIRVGGGIRSLAQAEEYLAAGARKIMIGSAAFLKDKIHTSFLDSMNQNIGKQYVIIALDSYETAIVKSGWTEKTSLSAADVIPSLELYCEEFLYTQVDREGLMGGTNFSRAIQLGALTGNAFAVAGGIASIQEIESLWAHKISSVLGMALYTGKIPLKCLT
jgi:phosphoribosylformimino-5-aminoimidazole carboxamide ribotide isomerase